MLGAIIGDIIGSVVEFNPIHTTEFNALNPRCFFTDDSVLTLATAEVLLHGGDYGEAYRRWGKKYPHRGYGGMFARWLADPNMGPYNSLGNGSAMRVAPVGWAFDSLEETLEEAKRAAECTHNHPEGIKGAQATAAAIFLARRGKDKAEIKSYLETTFEYDLSRTVEEVRKTSVFDETCPVSVPEAFIAFLGAESYEQTVRITISFGADADTQACIAGAIAEAYWRDIPRDWQEFAQSKLDEYATSTIKEFQAKYVERS